MKYILMILTIFFAQTKANSQSPGDITGNLAEGISKIEHAVKYWNKTEMTEAKTIFESSAQSSPENYLPLYWKAYADYKLAIYSLYTNELTRDEENAKQHIEDAVAVLEKAIEINSNDADSYALLGSLTGMKIMFNPISGMWLGPKSNGFFKKAVSANDKTRGCII